MSPHTHTDLFWQKKMKVNIDTNVNVHTEYNVEGKNELKSVNKPSFLEFPPVVLTNGM